MRVAMVEVGEVVVAVREWGPPDGPVVFFTHALGPASSAALFGPAVEPLVEAGYRVVAPDLPGFGLSPELPADGYPVGEVAALMWRLVDALGIGSTIVGGHSWGGAVAAHAAAARPERVRALFLLDSGHLDYDAATGAPVDATLDELVADSEARRLRARDRGHVAELLELAEADPVLDAIMEAMTDNGEGRLVSRTTATARAAVMFHLMRASQSGQWPAIAAGGFPVLLLLATVPDDARRQNEEAAARFRAAVPDADVRMVEGASHSMTTDLRERLGEILVDWLSTRL